jgi:uracil-DNA glycosylase
VTKLALLQQEIIACRACPRLVRWREQVAREKRRAFQDWTYWGRPVPGFGDPAAWLVLVGLAPGAHGSNRTGRMFTGDGSGSFLFPALHRAGLASQPVATSRDDGMRLIGTYIVAAARCAPPGNHPSPRELQNCAPFLDRELACLGGRRVLLALGAIGWRAVLDHCARTGHPFERPWPRFAHGAVTPLPGTGPRRYLLGSYHVSQQNTNTGKLTAAMFDAVLAQAATLRTA